MLLWTAAPAPAQWGRDADVQQGGDLPPPAPAPLEDSPSAPPLDLVPPPNQPDFDDGAGRDSQIAPDVQDPGAAPQPDSDWAQPPPSDPPPLDAAPLPERAEPEPRIAPADPVEHRHAKSSLGGDVWSGAQPEEIASVLRALPLPNRTPTLARLISDSLTRAPGDPEIALDALRRAGAADAMVAAAGTANGADAPRWRTLAYLAAGKDDRACALAGQPDAPDGSDRGEKRDSLPSLLLIAAYCSAAKGQIDAASLSIDLAREAGDDVRLAERVLKDIDTAGPVRELPDRIDVLDAAFLALTPGGGSDAELARASPLGLARYARDAKLRDDRRATAAERAAALDIVDGATLAAAWRDAPKDGKSPAAQRAALFRAADSADSPDERARAARALFNSVDEGILDFAGAQALSPVVAQIVPSENLIAFAETGLRIAMLSGDFPRAAAWAQLSDSQVGRRWRALLAVAAPDPDSATQGLNAATDLALSGRLKPDAMHRLVTVLDALDRDVPIPLWEKASASPQPSDGFLPKTGVLTALKETAERGETGLTILLAAAALGPDGAARANLIALGDVVRALNKVGLRQEAQQLGLDALYPLWLASDRAALR